MLPRLEAALDRFIRCGTRIKCGLFVFVFVFPCIFFYLPNYGRVDATFGGRTESSFPFAQEGSDCRLRCSRISPASSTSCRRHETRGGTRQIAHQCAESGSSGSSGSRIKESWDDFISRFRQPISPADFVSRFRQPISSADFISRFLQPASSASVSVAGYQ